jgi:hypothetical protein
LIEPTLKSTSVTVEVRPTAHGSHWPVGFPQRRAREDVSNDLPRDVISCGTNSHRRNDVNSECKLPHGAPLFFLYGFFAQYVLGVPAAVGNEIVVILEAL